MINLILVKLVLTVAVFATDKICQMYEDNYLCKIKSEEQL